MRSERDGTADHVTNFLDCVRRRKTPSAPIHLGFGAARTLWVGNITLKRGMKVAWQATKNRAAS